MQSPFFKKLDYDTLTTIKNFLPKKDENKLSLLNHDFKELFSENTQKQKDKKIIKGLKGLAWALSEILRSNSYCYESAKQANTILKEFILNLDPETLNDISSHFRLIERKVRNIFINPTIKYGELFKDFIEGIPESNPSKNKLKILCKNLDESENKNDNLLYDLFSTIQYINQNYLKNNTTKKIEQILKKNNLQYYEFSSFISILNAKNTLNQEENLLENSDSFIDLIENKLKTLKSLTQDELSNIYGEGSWSVSAHAVLARILLDLTLSVAISSLLAVLFLAGAKMSTATLFIGACIAITFLALEIFHQAKGLHGLIKADEHREAVVHNQKELKEELKTNLSLFFKPRLLEEAQNLKGEEHINCIGMITEENSQINYQTILPL